MAATALVAMPAGVATAQTAPTCFGRDVTILGTEGPDSVSGTPGHDVISVLGADDSVYGTDSSQEDVKDWICGGTESDQLGGADGNDWIDGERGNDTVGGQDGQDRLYGSGGNDVFYPSWGSDFVDGGEGQDIIQNDQDRSSRWNTDTFHGGEGSDQVGVGYAPSGSDALYGDSGDDRVDGRDCQLRFGCRNHPDPSSTPDLVDGGPGRDFCWVDADDTVVNCEEIRVVG